MMNRKTNIKAAIACAVTALAIMAGVLSFLAAPARAEDRPVETVGVSRLSDIEDGYDASASDIGYVVEIPVS